MKSLQFSLTFILVAGAAACANAQTILNDGFDTYSLGNVNGDGAWMTSATTYNVVTDGGSRPAATSGHQMLASNGNNDTCLNFIQTGWNTRSSGNDFLLLKADFYARSDDNSGRSINLGISSDQGNRVADILFSGNTFFGYSTMSGLSSGTASTSNAWHHLMMQLDYNGKSAKLFVDGSLIDTVAFASTDTLNSVYINSLIGTSTPTEAYWDSFGVQAVPEPASLCVLGLGLVVLMRRRSR